MPCDHFSVTVPFSKIDAEVAFITTAFEAFGIKEHMRPVPGVVGIGDNIPFLWLSGLDTDHSPIPDDAKIYRNHFALSAPNREAVDKFHAAALKSGGECNGKPGVRGEYHPNYYAAFVISPAGHNYEAVIHSPPAATAPAGAGQ